jgi:hypothetical protein
MITKVNTYKLYKKLLKSEEFLNEGLTKTYSILVSVDSINSFIKINITGTKNICTSKNNKLLLEIDTCNLNKFVLLLTRINNLGYYISDVVLVNKHNNMSNKIAFNVFKEKYFSDYTFDNFINFKLELEPKYDIMYIPENNIVYHVTEDIYLDKIIKNGLVPNTKNVIKDYPDRIYLSNTIDGARFYLKNKKRYNLSKYQQNKTIGNKITRDITDTIFVLLKINISKLDIKFYQDPNFIKYGFYTLDNIPSNYIKVVDENFKP